MDGDPAGRNDDLCEMVFGCHEGKSELLTRELDAMRSFLRTWSREYGDAKDYRLSMITGMLADLVFIVSLDLHLRAKAIDGEPESSTLEHGPKDP